MASNLLFFWGHTPKQIYEIDTSCLSQWYPSRFFCEGKRFLTAEHWMMYQKAMLFKDSVTALKILTASTPKEAKTLGRQVKNFDPDIWTKYRQAIVWKGNMLKFNQNPRLKNFLIQTGDTVLAEASPYDKIWGIGLRASDPQALTPCKWPGLNLLGETLMNVRTHMRNPYLG